MKQFAAATALLMVATPVEALDLDDVMGYTLAAKWTVESHMDKGEKKDGFEGCDFDRVIVFTNGRALRCKQYHYHYAYRPTAYIFVSKDGDVKMVIDDDIYEMSTS